MTSNQISYAKVVEDRRHNKATEDENVRHNKRSEQISKQQNRINKEHYERSDTSGYLSALASQTSANASAMNAQLQHDIEWSSGKFFGTDYSNVPMSAIVKGSQAYLTDQQTKTEEEKTRKSSHEADLAQMEAESYEERTKAEILNKLAGAGASILNSVFGKGGIVQSVSNLYARTNG